MTAQFWWGLLAGALTSLVQPLSLAAARSASRRLRAWRMGRERSLEVTAEYHQEMNPAHDVLWVGGGWLCACGAQHSDGGRMEKVER